MNGSNAGIAQAIDGTWMAFGDSIVEAELTGPERRALYADVARIHSQHADHEAEAGFASTMKEAAELLKLRIGGAQNLRSYVDTLMKAAMKS
jgi:hypothetical protein